ncbi:MAG: hypothetical protein U0L55_02900 [Acutalibacteraceae bacterium]|nr:hypothetical protein [Acutalibacteraceae bacterium]
MPSKFSVSGTYIRNSEKQKEFADKYNVRICSSLEELLKTAHITVSVKTSVNIISTVNLTAKFKLGITSHIGSLI